MGDIFDDDWEANPEVAVPIRVRNVQKETGVDKYYILGDCRLEYEDEE